jgi:hypothetical protein
MNYDGWTSNVVLKMDEFENILSAYNLLNSEDVSIESVLECVKDYYKLDNNAAGGNLHVVLDDGNIEDGSIKFCTEYAVKNNDYFGLILGKLLLKLTYDQRCELIQKHWGYEVDWL